MTTFDDHGLWWATNRQLWWRDFDELGHLTAARYADLYQEAAGDFVVEAWRDPGASYVVARLDIAFLREIRREGSPVLLGVKPTRVGRAGFELAMTVSDGTGGVCSRATGVYVAWDGESRGARPMTEAERAGLSALGGPPGSGLT